MSELSSTEPPRENRKHPQNLCIEPNGNSVTRTEEWSLLASYFSNLQGCCILVCQWKRYLMSVKGQIKMLAGSREEILNIRRYGLITEIQIAYLDRKHFILCLVSYASHVPVFISNGLRCFLQTHLFSRLSFPWAFEVLACSSDGHQLYQLYQAWHVLLVSDSPHRWCFSTWTTLSNMTFTYKVSEGWIRGCLIILIATGHFFL